MSSFALDDIKINLLMPPHSIVIFENMINFICDVLKLFRFINSFSFVGGATTIDLNKLLFY